MKLTGFALVNKNQQYLYFEQVGHKDIEVYTTPYETQAHLFDSEEKADGEAFNMINGDGEFNYMMLDEDKPFAIVKVTILTHAEEIVRLV